jgi:hypothetical protein
MIDLAIGRLIASGAYVAILPVGAWIARRVVPDIGTAPLRERLATAIALGVCAWSLLYVTLALAGVFFPIWIGALGWSVTALTGWKLLNEHGATQWKRTLADRRWPVLAAATALASLAVLYLAFPCESLLGLRDEAIYTLTALTLERTGSLAVSAPRHFIDVAPNLFALSIDGELSYVPGVYTTSAGLVLRFPPLFPAWIAQAHAAVGDIALYRVSGIFILASVPLFYALARRLLAPSIALLCCVIFALNPAQVWIARINLAESLGQAFVLAGLWLAVYALPKKAMGCMILAALAFGLSSLVRLDTVVLAPLVVAATAVAAIWGYRRTEHRDETITVLASVTVAAQIVAVAAVAIATPNYIVWNQAVLWIAALATVAFAFVVSGVRWLSVLAKPMTIVSLEWASAIVLVFLFIYAAWWRPAHGPFMTMHFAPGHPWEGQRDWREQSLVNLAAYLGWPTLTFALVGTVFLAIRVVRGRATAAKILLWIIVVPTSVAIFANPRISPDHFWAIRRFVPIVIPGAIMLAGIGLHATVVGYLRRVPTKMMLLLALVAGGALVVAQSATILVRENRGTTAQLRDLATLTAHAPMVIVRDLEPLATTLLVGFGQPVVPLRDTNTAVDERARALWSLCTPQVPCMLVHRDFAGLSGLELGDTKVLNITRDYIAPTPTPLPSVIEHEATRIFVTPVSGLQTHSDPRLLGAYRDWNIDDSGFYREELGREWSWRWTDGDAAIVLPPVAADRLELVLLVPEYRSVRASIALNGESLHEGVLGPGIVHLEFPLAGRPVVRELTIQSDTFVPKELGLDSLDNRRLGVAVLAVRLLDSSVARMRADSGADSYRAKLAMVNRNDEKPIVIVLQKASNIPLEIANRSDLIWPARNDLRSGEAPVALGMTWMMPGDSTPRLEQRVDLPFSLHPGERLLLAPALDPGTLPPGKYEVRIGLVHEGVAWFAQRGEALIRVPVTIEAR